MADQRRGDRVARVGAPARQRARRHERILRIDSEARREGRRGVAIDRRKAFLRALIDGLFTGAYLQARGLDDDAAEQHNAIVGAALEESFSWWDHFVGALNHVDRPRRPMLVFMLGSVVFMSLSTRLGAYLAAFGRVAPAARFALAAFGVQSGTGAASVCEIEVELRLACLIAAVRDLLAQRPTLREQVAFDLVIVPFFAHDLRRYDLPSLAEIIVQGTEWPRWKEVHERLTSHVLLPQMMSIANAMKVEADQRLTEVERLLEMDPPAAFRRAAEWAEQDAQRVRESAADRPGWEHTIAGDLVRLHEQHAALCRAAAEGREPPYLSFSDDTLRAKCLCEEAITPWNPLSREQKEKLLEQAVELDPACGHVRKRAAAFFAQDGTRAADAIRHLRAALLVNEQDNEARVSLAGLLLGERRYPEVLEVLEPAACEPDFLPEGLVYRGAALTELGRVDDGDACFDAILASNPRHVGALMGKAEVCRKSGDRRGAARFQREADFHAGRLPLAS
jgi:tetratricopeptide (TPR) repeat protein